MLPLVGFGRAVRRRGRAAQQLAEALGCAERSIGASAALHTLGSRIRVERRFPAAACQGPSAVVIFLVFAGVVVVPVGVRKRARRRAGASQSVRPSTHLLRGEIAQAVWCRDALSKIGCRAADQGVSALGTSNWKWCCGPNFSVNC